MIRSNARSQILHGIHHLLSFDDLRQAFTQVQILITQLLGSLLQGDLCPSDSSGGRPFQGSLPLNYALSVSDFIASAIFLEVGAAERSHSAGA